MGLMIDEVITDHLILREGCVLRSGFVFIQGQDYPPVFDRLLIRCPVRAQTNINMRGHSYKTLDEHIALINEYRLTKAAVICDDLSFITKCPSIKDIRVYPSFDAKPSFDYSPLYALPNLQTVSVRTRYGEGEKYRTTIDYSKIPNLQGVSAIGDGHLHLNEVPTLKKIWRSGDKKLRDLFQLSCSTQVEDLTVFSCGVHSLSGCEQYRNLTSVHLLLNRSLSDISALKYTSSTLKQLAIEGCPRIKDFSVLSTLKELEHLQLDGSNTLPSLDFLKEMKHLRAFTLSMKVEDGDMSNCLALPYATCKNYKHYNLKNEDLPKENKRTSEDEALEILNTYLAESHNPIGPIEKTKLCADSQLCGELMDFIGDIYAEFGLDANYEETEKGIVLGEVMEFLARCMESK